MVSTPKPKTKNISVAVVKKNSVQTLAHQKKVVDFISKDSSHGIIVFHSVGSGKTITSLLAAQAIMKKYPTKHVIIATPASLVSNFEQTIDKLKLPFKNRIKVDSYQKYSKRFKTSNAICADSILIIDEVHNLNGGGETFKKFFECAKRSFKVILLTGTLVKNFPSEIAKQLSLIEGVPVAGKVIETITMVSDDNRRQRFFNTFFKCKISFYDKTDLSNFPKVSHNIVNLPMSKEYYKEYYDIQENIKYDLPKFLQNTKDLTTFLNGIRRATNKTKTLSPKIKWIAERIVKDYNEGKKILIYSNWIDTGIVILKNILEAENIKFSKVIGGMTKKEKDTSVSDFNSGKTRIMLLSASGSEGLDLKETRTVIIMEPYWNRTRILQVVGRAARYRSHYKLPPNQRTVDVFHLVLTKPPEDQRMPRDRVGSADEILLEKSGDKQDIINVFYDTIKRISIENDKSCLTN